MSLFSASETSSFLHQFGAFFWVRRWRRGPFCLPPWVDTKSTSIGVEASLLRFLPQFCPAPERCPSLESPSAALHLASWRAIPKIFRSPSFSCLIADQRTSRCAASIHSSKVSGQTSLLSTLLMIHF